MLPSSPPNLAKEESAPPYSPKERFHTLLLRRRERKNFFSLPWKRKGDQEEEKKIEEKVIQATEEALEEAALNTSTNALIHLSLSDKNIETKGSEYKKKVSAEFKKRHSLTIDEKQKTIIHRQRQAAPLHALYPFVEDKHATLAHFIISLGQGTFVEHLEKVAKLGLKQSKAIELLSQFNPHPHTPPPALYHEAEERNQETPSALFPQNPYDLATYRSLLAGLPTMVEPLQFFTLISLAIEWPKLPAKNKWALLKACLEWALLPRQEGLLDNPSLVEKLHQIAEKGIFEQWGVLEGKWLLYTLSQNHQLEAHLQKGRLALYAEEEMPNKIEAPFPPLIREGEREERQAQILAAKLQTLMAHIFTAIPISEFFDGKYQGVYLNKAGEFFDSLTLFFVYHVLKCKNSEKAARTLYFIRLVQKNLLKRGDYNSLMALECCFSNYRISKLSECQHLLEKNSRYQTLAKKFDKLLKFKANLRNLREAIGDLFGKKPLIPVIAIYSKDLVSAREQPSLDRDLNLNKDKMSILGASLLQLQILQSKVGKLGEIDHDLWHAINGLNCKEQAKIGDIVEAFLQKLKSSTLKST